MGNVLHEFWGGVLVVGQDFSGVQGLLDEPGSLSFILFLDPEPLPEAGIGHEVPTDIPEGRVLITRPDPISLIHLRERALGKQHGNRAFSPRLEQGSRKLIELNFGNDLVDAAATFFTYPKAPSGLQAFRLASAAAYP